MLRTLTRRRTIPSILPHNLSLAQCNNRSQPPHCPDQKPGPWQHPQLWQQQDPRNQHSASSRVDERLLHFIDSVRQLDAAAALLPPSSPPSVCASDTCGAACSGACCGASTVSISPSDSASCCAARGGTASGVTHAHVMAWDDLDEDDDQDCCFWHTGSAQPAGGSHAPSQPESSQVAIERSLARHLRRLQIRSKASLAAAVAADEARRASRCRQQRIPGRLPSSLPNLATASCYPSSRGSRGAAAAPRCAPAAGAGGEACGALPYQRPAAAAARREPAAAPQLGVRAGSRTSCERGAIGAGPKKAPGGAAAADGAIADAADATGAAAAAAAAAPAAGGIRRGVFVGERAWGRLQQRFHLQHALFVGWCAATTAHAVLGVFPHPIARHATLCPYKPCAQPSIALRQPSHHARATPHAHCNTTFFMPQPRFHPPACPPA